MANAVSLARTGLTPYDSTAASLSRNAISTRPVRLLRMPRTATNASIMAISET